MFRMVKKMQNLGLEIVAGLTLPKVKCLAPDLPLHISFSLPVVSVAWGNKSKKSSTLLDCKSNKETQDLLTQFVCTPVNNKMQVNPTLKVYSLSVHLFYVIWARFHCCRELTTPFQMSLDKKTKNKNKNKQKTKNKKKPAPEH